MMIRDVGCAWEEERRLSEGMGGVGKKGRIDRGGGLKLVLIYNGVATWLAENLRVTTGM